MRRAGCIITSHDEGWLNDRLVYPAELTNRVITGGGGPELTPAPSVRRPAWTESLTLSLPLRPTATATATALLPPCHRHRCLQKVAVARSQANPTKSDDSDWVEADKAALLYLSLPAPVFPRSITAVNDQAEEDEEMLETEERQDDGGIVGGGAANSASAAGSRAAPKWPECASDYESDLDSNASDTEWELPTANLGVSRAGGKRRGRTAIAAKKMEKNKPSSAIALSAMDRARLVENRRRGGGFERRTQSMEDTANFLARPVSSALVKTFESPNFHVLSQADQSGGVRSIMAKLVEKVPLLYGTARESRIHRSLSLHRIN